LFSFDEDELAEPIQTLVQTPLDRLLKIARACPGEAITITDEQGNPVPLT
jgi:hypothetical protein